MTPQHETERPPGGPRAGADDGRAPSGTPGAGPELTSYDELRAQRDAAVARADDSRRSLAALRATTVAIAGASSVAEAVEVILGVGLEAVGAVAGLVAMGAPGSARARVVAASGCGAVGSLPDEFPLDDATPVGRAVTRGEAVFHRAVADPAPPDGGRAAATLPLRSAGQVRGAITWSFPAGETFDAERVAALGAMAELTAAALVRVQLLEDEERIRRDAAERHAFLAQATALVSAPLDEQRVLERLAQLCVPRLGDWCSIVRPRGEVLERVIVHHRDPALEPLVRRMEGTTLDVEGAGPVSATFRTGSPVLLTDLRASFAADPTANAQLHDVVGLLGDAAGVVVPIGPASRPVGVLAFAVGAGRSLTEDDVALAGEIALRAGIAVTHAESFARERDAATLLQRAILPATLPAVPGLELAASYRPAEVARTIGGDWFDACAIDGRRVAFAVGDVAGHGIGAAATMGQLRNALRAYLFEGHGPGVAVERLNRLLMADRRHQYATVVAGVLDLDTGELVLASAGHLPPVLTLGGVTVSSEQPRGPLLGVTAAATYAEHRLCLAPDDLVVLFTDGLIERRQGSLDVATSDLCRVVAADPPVLGRLQPWCDALVAAQAAHRDHDDDSCVLALRWRPRRRAPVAVGQVLVHLELDAEPGTAATVRRQLAALLPRHGQLAELQVCATEVVTNAVRHAGTAFTVTLSTTSSAVRVAVADASTVLPRARDHHPTAPSGRGLHLLEAMASSWGVEPDPDGKVVWFEFPPSD